MCCELQRIISLQASSPRRFGRGRGGKRKESLQLHLWNLNSTSNSPVAPRRLSCRISANQREAKTSDDNDVITNVISVNQHFASNSTMQVFKFQKSTCTCSCKISFLFPPRGQSAPESLLPGQRIIDCLTDLP